MNWLYLAAILAVAVMFKYLRFLGWMVIAEVFPALRKRLRRKKEHADAKPQARAMRSAHLKNQT